MSKFKIFAAAILVTFTVIILISGKAIIPENNITGNKDEGIKDEEVTGKENGKENKKEKNEGEERGIKVEKEFFNRVYYPYGHFLPSDINSRVLNNIESAPDEKQLHDFLPVNQWVLIGPRGGRNLEQSSPSSLFSGRILDVEIDNNSGLRIGSATGGIWQQGNPPVPLSDKVSSLSIGSFTTHPTNPNIIFAGTGEPAIRAGSGLWKTTDGGTNWVQVNMGSDIYAFSKIRYINNNPNVIYASGHGGFFTSGDGGSLWQRRNVTGANPAPGNDVVSDFIVDPSNLNIIIAAVWDWGTGNGGIYKSTNGGANWNKITNGIPGTNVGNTTLAFSPALPSTIYANVCRNDNSQTLGVYKSITSGDAWANYTNDLPEFHNGQGFHCCAIGVSPVNPNIALVGGVTLYRTTNGGINWTYISSPDVHADEQIIRWNNAGTVLYVGNDGGLSVSTNNGINWTSTINNFPVTQFYYLSNGVSNTNYLLGGTQDNGMYRTTNGGAVWDITIGGDGSGAAIDPFNSQVMYGINGLYNNPLPFFRLKSTNGGSNWSFINNGISTNCGRWFPAIYTDEESPVWLYTNQCNRLFRSQDQGASWVQLSPDFAGEIGSYSVSSNGSAIYCSMDMNANATDKIKVYNGSSWAERHTGIPDNVYVYRLRVHTNNSLSPQSAYAITRPGLGNPCLYKTNNQGLNWRPISDAVINNTFVTDILPDPRDTNKLYLATSTGSFRSTNAGVSWHKWNNGMPDGTIINELSFIDSTSINKIYAVAGTFGRSIYIREVSGDDPLTGVQNYNIPSAYSLQQNFPNPFNPVTVIKFSLPVTGTVKINVYDITGKVISELVNKKYDAGNFEIRFDGSVLSSGVYFYRMTAPGFTEVKKMMLVK